MWKNGKRILSIWLLLSLLCSVVLSADVLVSIADLESWTKDLYLLQGNLQQKQIELDGWQSKALLSTQDLERLQQKLDELQKEVSQLLTALEISEMELTKTLQSFQELSLEWNSIQRKLEKKIKNWQTVSILTCIGGLLTGIGLTVLVYENLPNK